MEQRISEYLEIQDVSGQRVIQCTKCKYVFCPATDNYKDWALVNELPPTQAGPIHHETDQFVLREFYCPGCATMLEVEMCLRGAPYIRDFVLGDLG
jgi:acetone carboxylase gamma subunit